MEYLQYIPNDKSWWSSYSVLNLIINGIPSILPEGLKQMWSNLSFKPYYKWNTFNTKIEKLQAETEKQRFKPYYKWNTFNT